MGLTKKQKEVFDFIVAYQQHHGHSPTQNEIKDYFGLKSLGSVQKYLQYLNKEGLLDTNWNHRRGIEIKSISENDSAIIPLLGQIAAGHPILAIENSSNFITIPKHFIRGAFQYFALTIKGESMKDLGILDNDLIICRSTQNATNGEIVVASINGEATLKVLSKKNDQSIQLLPANENFKAITINPNLDDFKILGTLSGLLRNY